jgi:hypothetical protein
LRREVLRLAGAATVFGSQVAHAATDVRLSTLLTLRPQSGPMRESAPNITSSTLYNLESAPRWVRLIYVAVSRSYTVDGAAIAPTGAIGDGFTPVGATGQPDNAAWRRVTFNHNGDASTPAALTGAPVYSLAVPSRSVPTMGFSDWLRIEPLPRSDGGAGSLVQVRTFSIWGFRNFAAIWQEVPDKQIDRSFATFGSNGDGTAAPWVFHAEPDQLSASYGLQYIAENAGATVIGVGDSITAPPASIPYGMRACALISTPQHPVSYVNDGFIGRKSAEFLASGARAIRALRPQVALLQTYSGNDPDTVAASDQAFDGAMHLAGLCRSLQCVPIFVASPPSVQFNPLSAGVRRSLMRTRALGLSGSMVLDLDAIWGKRDGTGAWKDGYRTDRWHPNNVASVAAAQVLVPMLRKLVV